MSTNVNIVSLPADGVWRIGRGSAPLKPPDRRSLDLGDSRAGNRFDSASGSYGVLYFSSSLEGCFGETLNRYRKDPSLAFIDDDEAKFMNRGHVPADWRQRRTAVRVQIDEDAPTDRFLDVDDPATIQIMAEAFRPAVMIMGYEDIDAGLLRGPDRRVTRLISQWAWHQEDADGRPMFAGIRYLSRSNSRWECWAVFDDIPLDEVERQPILLSTDGLKEVERLYDLRVY